MSLAALSCRNLDINLAKNDPAGNDRRASLSSTLTPKAARAIAVFRMKRHDDPLPEILAVCWPWQFKL